MLTPLQEKWIESLSDRKISIVPYDDRSEQLYTKIRDKVHDILGQGVTVEHCGASSLGVLGQDEIDVSILAHEDQFDEYVQKLEKVFGPVRSRYSDRARFEVREDGKKIDLKIVDMNHRNYRESKVFEDHLRRNPEDLEIYKNLKAECNGMKLKEYYRRKTEFLNEILEKYETN